MTLLPMMAESVEAKDVARYIYDENHFFQTKLDGHRVVMEIHDNEPLPLNRHGTSFKGHMPKAVLDEFRSGSFVGTWVFDGELLDQIYYVFDILATPKSPELRTAPYQSRLQVLDAIFNVWQCFNVQLLGTVRTPHGKRDLLDAVRKQGGEGIVIKHRYAPYEPGKRSTNWLKYKLIHEVDAVVTELWRGGKRSVALGLYDLRGDLVDVGACSMTERNLARIEVGSVVEITYLYQGNGGRLFQPRLRRLRPDKRPEECLLSQLKVVNKSPILLPNETGVVG